MKFPRMTSTSKNLSIKAYIYLLMGIWLSIATVIGGYSYWQTAVSHKTEEAASQYHLTTILHAVQAKESLRHMVAHRSYARLSEYEPDHNLDLEHEPEYGAPYNPNIDIALVKTHLETIIALQNVYVYPEFTVSVQNIAEHLVQLQNAEDILDADPENAFLDSDVVAQLLITLEQLQRLHAIAHKELLHKQSIQTQQNNRNMLLLLGVIIIAGFVISTMVLDLISRTLAQQKADEEKIRQRNETLATFNAIAAAVNQSPELDAVLATALAEAEKTLGLKHSEIWLLDGENGRLLSGAHHGLADDFALEIPSWQIGEGVSGIVAESKQPLLIEDLINDPRFLREHGARHEFHTVLGIPLLSQEQLVGVINFFTHKPNRFTPELKARLTTIGYLLGTAIENSRLFTTVRQELAERIQAEKALHESQHLFTEVIEQSQEGIGVADTTGKYVLVNSALSNMVGYSPEELLNMNVRDLVPLQVELKLFPKVVAQESGTEVTQLQRKDGSIFYAEVSGTPITTEGKMLVLGVVRDITKRIQAERERLAYLWRLENIDRIDRAVQQTSDLEQMMHDVLQTVLDIFDCDRAWLLYPCDPDAPFWQVPMECTRPEYPGALALGEDVPMLPDAVAIFKMALGSAIPVCYDPQTGLPLQESTKRFSVQSQMITAVYPKADNPWLLGIHQCSYARVWTESEQKLFQEIGYKITDALSSLLFLRDLQESEARYRLLFENAPVGIISTDSEGKTIAVNPAAVDMVGAPSVEAAKQINFLTHPHLVDVGLAADMQHCLQTGEIVVAERYYKSTWQREGYFHYQMTPIHNTESQIVGTQLILEDISKRKEAEAEISRLATVIEQAAVAIFITDLDGNIGYANRATETMTGYALSELLGQNTRLFQSGRHDHAFYKQLWQTISGGESWRGEFTNKRKDGIIYYEEATLFPIKNGTGRIINYAAIKRDISQEKEREQRAREQDRLAAVGQLAAGVAHDFNNIMAVIVLYAQLTQYETNLSAKVQDRMQTIEEQALYASELTQQILDFSRRAILTQRSMPLIPFMKELFKLLERTLPENIRLNLSFGEEEYIIYADPTRIQQVIMNLALNARDAMIGGGEFRVVLARVAVEEDGIRPFSELASGDWIQIMVSDNGTGISDEALPYIFDPFFTTKAPGKGSGLGLAQVHGIIKQHGGHVDVTTKVNEGTVLTLYLPAMLHSTPSQELAQDVAAYRQGNGETILLVEDNNATREALIATLEQFNYRVLTAVNGHEGLEQYRQHKDDIALLISDVIMPVMGGVELLHILRTEGTMVPIIMLSGHPKQIGIDLLPEQGYVDWLSKPPELQQLGRAINQALQA